MEKHPTGDMDRTVGVAKRFAAVFIDGIVIGVAMVILMAIFGGLGAATGSSRAGLAAAGAVYLLYPVVFFGYFIVLEALYGYTLGKLALGIVVKGDEGDDIGWVESLIRNVLRIVDGFLAYLVGAIVIWITDREQRIGDLAGSTVVVEKA